MNSKALSRNHMQRAVLLLLVSTLGLGASKCALPKITADISPVFAMEANDPTVIIEGCGSQPVSGYTYCRMREGSQTLGKITLIAPPAACQEDSCVSFTLYFPDGSASLGYQVKRGTVRQDVPWKDLLKTDTFQKNQRGFWPIVMRWKWIGQDGKEYESIAEGEIRLRVLASNYTSLHEVREDPNFAWAWTENKVQFRMTSAGRASTWKE